MIEALRLRPALFAFVAKLAFCFYREAGFLLLEHFAVKWNHLTSHKCGQNK